MTSTVTYTGDGATRVFPVAFEIQGENYVVVFIDDVAVNDRTTYDIINNSIVFVEDNAPAISSVIEIVVASSPTEIADLNAPPSTVQTIIDNLADINSVVNTVVPNIAEILLADDNATIATTQAGIATAQAVIATTKASEASISAGNALTSENNADTSESNALSYKNSAEASATTATTQAGIATTKASEASVSASNALASETQAGIYAGLLDPSSYVKTTGDETIAGVKTFTASPIVPTPTLANQPISMGNIIEKTGVGIGYGTGSGGTVTQLTSKSTTVTLNKPCGQIIMNNSSLAAGASVIFNVLNTYCSNADTVTANSVWLGAGVNPVNYLVQPLYTQNNAFFIKVTNTSGGSLAEALVIQFNILKGATA